MARSVLIVKTSSLGDVIHNMPAVSDIRRRFPNAAIDWLVEEAYAPLVELHPAIRRVLPVALRRWRKNLTRNRSWREFGALRRLLGEREYDFVIDTQGLLKSALLARMASGVRAGFDRASIREPLAARFYDKHYAVDRALHATERCRRLCAAALGYELSGPLDYGLPRSDTLPRAERRVLLLHGTARADKLWPEPEWRELARALIARGWKIELLSGSPVEIDRSNRLALAVGAADVHPPLALDALCRLFGEMSVVIGVDTGLLHLAAALERPLVGVFGATDPALTGPRGTGPMRVCGDAHGFPSVADVVDAAQSVTQC